MKQTKLQKAFFECITELYANATPKADFMELYNNAPINERNEKVIDFNAYTIDNDLLVSIIENTIKKYKFNKYEGQSLRFHTYLGASPRSIYKDKIYE